MTASVDRDTARTALLDPTSLVSEMLGDRPTGFAAREAWMRDAATLTARDVPFEHAPSIARRWTTWASRCERSNPRTSRPNADWADSRSSGDQPVPNN
jgi:hypothetical protein